MALASSWPRSIDSGALPALPTVEYLSLRWLRRSDAVALKNKLAGVRHHRILGTRTDAWIADNADNPFRGWVDDSAALGRAAKKAWKTARAATRMKPERVLENLLAELNRLDDRYDLETHHREQAWDAFLALAKDLGVAKRQATKIFEKRQF